MAWNQTDRNKFNASLENKYYVDFFSGCGGLSLGLGSAGWNGLFAIEKDPMAYATFEHNLVADNSPYRHFRSWPDWIWVCKINCVNYHRLFDTPIFLSLKIFSTKLCIIGRNWQTIFLEVNDYVTGF